ARRSRTRRSRSQNYSMRNCRNSSRILAKIWEHRKLSAKHAGSAKAWSGAASSIPFSNGRVPLKRNIMAKTNSNGHNVNHRWEGVTRPYTTADVERLRGSMKIEYTLAKQGAERLWSLLKTEPYVNALGAMTGNQAIQQVNAGLQAIYVSG